MSSTEKANEQLLCEYRDVLIEMDARRVKKGAGPRRWNRLVDQMQALHLRLRETAEGRAGITRLCEHENPTVRAWSATNALAWDEAVARAVLERLAHESNLDGFGAEVTLREFDAGRLDTTWEPRLRRRS